MSKTTVEQKTSVNVNSPDFQGIAFLPVVSPPKESKEIHQGDEGRKLIIPRPPWFPSSLATVFVYLDSPARITVRQQNFNRLKELGFGEFLTSTTTQMVKILGTNQMGLMMENMSDAHLGWQFLNMGNFRSKPAIFTEAAEHLKQSIKAANQPILDPLLEEQASILQSKLEQKKVMAELDAIWVGIRKLELPGETEQSYIRRVFIGDTGNHFRFASEFPGIAAGYFNYWDLIDLAV